MGKISKSEPRHRICYEYADYGDLWDLIAWYHKHRYTTEFLIMLWSLLIERNQPYTSGSVYMACLALHGKRSLLLLLWNQQALFLQAGMGWHRSHGYKAREHAAYNS